eukprot:TRINITY_DN18406_c0_g1_i2.p2 TRINITY_DN18406_c0_g1~~TRINITY_DN18406_c0_g1_i2.p2  ORF type:complete len:272 (+),score=58.22 TRINITY_DN18406_c0_g1_i2:95-910(+)
MEELLEDGIFVPPDTVYTAEVVVLGTNSTAVRRLYAETKRIRDLLEIKRVHFKFVNLNYDAESGEQIDEKNSRTHQMLEQLQGVTFKNDGSVEIPQVFIDGILIGGCLDLQCLEDDGDLEEMLLSEKCPCCSHVRNFNDICCEDCGSKFVEMLPGEQTLEDVLKLYAKYYEIEYDEEAEHGGFTEWFPSYFRKPKTQEEVVSEKTVTTDNPNANPDVVTNEIADPSGAANSCGRPEQGGKAPAPLPHSRQTAQQNQSHRKHRASLCCKGEL